MYWFIKRIGRGAFGEIYLGLELGTNDEVAIKIEPIDTKDPQLRIEAKVYASIKGEIGFPLLRWIGTGKHYTAMVIDLLGFSLDKQFLLRGRFSLKTVLMLADQMITRLEQLHSHGFVHRDIKPANFLIGRGRKSDIIHLIDFGLSSRWWNGIDHINYKEGESLVGTACFSSINTHLGIKQTRRDDLESLGYMLISFLTGSLPWLGIKTKDKELRNLMILKKKITIDSNSLCKDLPIEFVEYLNYIKSLKFKELPDYNYLRLLFRNLLFKKGYQNDFRFDWVS